MNKNKQKNENRSKKNSPVIDRLTTSAGRLKPVDITKIQWANKPSKG